ncbi:MAG TPA: hypothetical protein VJ790_02330 [Dongiaceae bacterium]|nr:hypothetical protein [Dongiaceae bacterium]
MASVLNRRTFLITAVPALALLSGLGADKVQAESIDVGDIFIGELEKRLIASYYHRQLVAYQLSPEYRKGKKNHKHKGLPPGLAKKGKVPPGIAKQLARNNHLPSDLEYRPLPHDLIVQMPPLQPGYIYRIVDDRVLLIRAASNLILDVLTVAALDVLS